MIFDINVLRDINSNAAVAARSFNTGEIILRIPVPLPLLFAPTLLYLLLPIILPVLYRSEN